MKGRTPKLGWTLPQWLFPTIAWILFLPLLFALYDAGHWPFVHDAPLMHYIVFLIGKGFVPYRDIIDMNPPATYILESLGMHLFGGGAHGWFLWDLSCDAAVVAASSAIAGPGRRTAGLIAGILACCVHLSDGAVYLGQRDWTVAALLLLSFACLFHIARGGHPHWSSGVFFFAIWALSVKPSTLWFCLLAAASLGFLFRKSATPIVTWLGWGVLGAAMPILVVILFVARWHAAPSFLDTFSTLVPYYASLQRAGIATLLWSSLGPIYKLLCLPATLALALYLLDRSWRSMQSNVLLLAAFCGLLHYLMQDKAWAYQRYPAIVFATLWILIEIEKALVAQAATRWIASAALVVVVALPPAAVLRERLKPYSTDKMLHLEADLQTLGGERLSHTVQCLDMTHGECINVLYRLNLVQSTGFIYDFYLFPEKSTPLTTQLQNRFFSIIAANPPSAFIVSEQAWPASSAGYRKLTRWAAFNSYLSQHYRLATEYVPPSPDTEGYRIYLRQADRQAVPDGKRLVP